jgi:hypothetical protein
MKDIYNTQYWELLYIRDVQKYGNLYSKFYFFETQLIKALQAKGVNINSKPNKSPDLSKTLNLGCENRLINKKDKKIINDARNAIFHYNNTLLKFPYESHNVEKILDQYITKFLHQKYTTKGNVIVLAKNVLKDILSDFCALQDFNINQKEFSFSYKGKFFKGFLSFMPDKGGAQNKEYSKVINFLSNSEICRNENTIFLAICDGDYYLQKVSKTGDEAKIKRLERLTDRKTSFALKIDDLKDFLAKF